jgi:glycerophosphoryl diester phosphodiesterase
LPSRSPKQPSFWESKKPILIAHRGGDAAGASKENTLVAFAAASKLGYEYGETDVVLSSDGQVVALHGSKNKVDSYFKKRRPSRPAVQRMSFQKISERVSVGGERVPLLEDILVAQPQMKFFIDPKTDEVVSPLAELLKRIKVLDRVCVNSFNYNRMQHFIELLKPHEVCAGVIIGRGIRVSNKNLDKLKEGKLENVSYVHLHHSHLSRGMVRLAHSYGIKVFVWTANSPLSIKSALKAGADGIISDNIELLNSLARAKS